MYQVFVETAPLEEEVELERVADQLVGSLNDSQLAKGAAIGINLHRRTLDMTCSIDAASDARTAIILAASELEARLAALGILGISIIHAEADPEVISGDATDRLSDLVTSTEAAEIVGVSRQRFNELSRRTGFPPAFGRIGKALVYSRSAIQRWTDARSDSPAGETVAA